MPGQHSLSQHWLVVSQQSGPQTVAPSGQHRVPLTVHWAVAQHWSPQHEAPALQHADPQCVCPGSQQIPSEQVPAQQEPLQQLWPAAQHVPLQSVWPEGHAGGGGAGTPGREPVVRAAASSPVVAAAAPPANPSIARMAERRDDLPANAFVSRSN